ncbi:unnamed protein product, partial [Adineta steineri]
NVTKSIRYWGISVGTSGIGRYRSIGIDISIDSCVGVDICSSVGIGIGISIGSIGIATSLLNL